MHTSVLSCPLSSLFLPPASFNLALPFSQMHPDLQHLIHLQELDLIAERTRRRIADMPAARAALDESVAAKTAAVEGVKQRLAANQAARRDIEKDLAAVQSRLSKFKNQL